MARTCILVCFFRLLKVFSLYSLPLFICKVKRAFSERFIFKDVHKQRALVRLFIHAFLIPLYHASPQFHANSFFLFSSLLLSHLVLFSRKIPYTSREYIDSSWIFSRVIASLRSRRRPMSNASIHKFALIRRILEVIYTYGQCSVRKAENEWNIYNYSLIDNHCYETHDLCCPTGIFPAYK